MTSNTDIAATGIEGLDLILLGGLPGRRVYLVQGDPGVGKTTLGLQFLLEGKREVEKCPSSFSIVKLPIDLRNDFARLDEMRSSERVAHVESIAAVRHVRRGQVYGVALE